MNQLGERSYESLQVGFFFSIFLYSPFFLVLFQLIVKVESYLGPTHYNRRVSFWRVSMFSHLESFVFSFILVFLVCKRMYNVVLYFGFNLVFNLCVVDFLF